MKQKKHGFIHIFLRPWHYETALTAQNNNRINSHFFHNLASINLNNINQNFLRLPFLSFAFDRFFVCLYIDLIKNCLRGEILTKFGLRPKLKFICINLPFFFLMNYIPIHAYLIRKALFDLSVQCRRIHIVHHKNIMLTKIKTDSIDNIFVNKSNVKKIHFSVLTH